MPLGISLYCPQCGVPHDIARADIEIVCIDRYPRFGVLMPLLQARWTCPVPSMVISADSRFCGRQEHGPTFLTDLVRDYDLVVALSNQGALLPDVELAPAPECVPGDDGRTPLGAALDQRRLMSRAIVALLSGVTITSEIIDRELGAR